LVSKVVVRKTVIEIEKQEEQEERSHTSKTKRRCAGRAGFLRKLTNGLTRPPVDRVGGGGKGELVFTKEQISTHPVDF
jgi:hypothetical protein